MNGLVRTILIVFLILLLIGSLPSFGYMGGTWYPTGGLGLVLLVLIILMLIGKL